MPKVTQPPLSPFWQTKDQETVRLYLGNVADVLARLPEKYVHCCVTSPPYWGLRDYGTGTWEGGDPECDHKAPPNGGRTKGSSLAGPGNRDGYSADGQYKKICGKCGAGRVDNQLGAEPSPDCDTRGQAQCGQCFVCSMVAVFRGVRRVLRDDGTLWLNLGSSYGPDGQMVWTPAMVALALQADGWVLRSDIPWVKRSPMPESVRNRPAKALEYVFLLVKRSDYYFDMEAVKPKSLQPIGEAKQTGDQKYLTLGHSNGTLGTNQGAASRNFRQADLWFQSVDTPHGLTGVKYEDGSEEIVGVDMTSQGYEGAHFATFPPRLIEPMILAGTSKHGCCAECGSPWRRMTEETKLRRERPNDYVKRTGEEGTGNSCSNSVAGVEVETVGWEPTCECGTEEVVPCTVLDPFIGSGTTCAVSLDHDRRSIGIDLSEQYLTNNSIPRIEGVLLAKPETAWLVRRERKKTLVGRPTTKK